MQLQRFVEALKADLAAVAELGGEESAEIGRRIAVSIQGSLGLRVLDVLGEAALQLNAQLPEGRVEVRLVGQDPELVYVAEEPEGPPAAPEEAYTARITLRLPDALKGALEAVAAREGVSVNTWIVRALSRSASAPAVRSSNRLTGYAQS